MTTKESLRNYEAAITMMIKAEGIEAANIANHKALETGLIRLDQFQAGARIIAKAFLN